MAKSWWILSTQPGIKYRTVPGVSIIRNNGCGTRLYSCSSCLFSAMSTMMINAHMDDTDLLYRCSSVDMSVEEFVAGLQRAVDQWMHLVHASGVHVKQSKSFWYLTIFKFLNGVATPAPARLDPSRLGLTIPQPAIPLQRYTHSSKSLGVRSGPSNNCVGQVDAMKEKGLEYAATAKVGSSPLRHREGWHSLNLQAYPSIFFGASCVRFCWSFLHRRCYSIGILSTATFPRCEVTSLKSFALFQ